MFPAREEFGEQQYHEHLATIRKRVLGYAMRRLVPQHANFAEAEDIAQSCVVALWEHYPEKRDLGEMTAIAVGVARNKIAQFRRDRERRPETIEADIPADDALLDRVAAREAMDRALRAMLALPARCRELLRLKLIEQKDYPEIRLLLGISGNVYEMMRRCHKELLRRTGGGLP